MWCETWRNFPSLFEKKTLLLIDADTDTDRMDDTEQRNTIRENTVQRKCTNIVPVRYKARVYSVLFYPTRWHDRHWHGMAWHKLCIIHSSRIVEQRERDTHRMRMGEKKIFPPNTSVPETYSMWCTYPKRDKTDHRGYCRSQCTVSGSLAGWLRIVESVWHGEKKKKRERERK